MPMIDVNEFLDNNPITAPGVLDDKRIKELVRKVSFYESTGVFVIDARRYLSSGDPILSEVAALASKVEAANRQYDLDSLPLMVQDVEDAKAKARAARDKYLAHKNTIGEIQHEHNATYNSYQNAVAQVNNLVAQPIDRYASQKDIDAHNRRIAQAQAEVDRRRLALNDTYVDKASYQRTLAQLENELRIADAAVTHAQKLAVAVKKRLCIDQPILVNDPFAPPVGLGANPSTGPAKVLDLPYKGA